MPSAEIDDTRDELEAFLDHEENKQIPQNRMCYRNADNQGKLRCFIGQRIQNLAQSGHHIEMPGDFSVNQISETGDCQNSACNKVVSRLRRIQINQNVYWNQYQPE